MARKESNGLSPKARDLTTATTKGTAMHRSHTTFTMAAIASLSLVGSTGHVGKLDPMQGGRRRYKLGTTCPRGDRFGIGAARKASRKSVRRGMAEASRRRNRA